MQGYAFSNVSIVSVSHAKVFLNDLLKDVKKNNKFQSLKLNQLYQCFAKHIGFNRYQTLKDKKVFFLQKEDVVGFLQELQISYDYTESLAIKLMQPQVISSSFNDFVVEINLHSLVAQPAAFYDDGRSFYSRSGFDRFLIRNKYRDGAYFEYIDWMHLISFVNDILKAKFDEISSLYNIARHQHIQELLDDNLELPRCNSIDNQFIDLPIIPDGITDNKLKSIACEKYQGDTAFFFFWELLNA